MAHSPSSPGLPYRADLQGLRAIAVLLVVLSHAGLPGIAGGFIGVDVFFVLSGYLITGLLLRELEREGTISLSRFYARRLKRLLPALIVMITVITGVAVFLLSSLEFSAQLKSSPFAVTWTSNLFFAIREVDYFDELAARDLFLHTWSLAVEEQFYLLWPLLLFALFRIRKVSRNPGCVWAGVLVTFAASLSLSVYWTIQAPQFAYYLMPSRIWQFCLGAFAFLILYGEAGSNPMPIKRNPGALAWIVLCTGLLMILGSAVTLHANTSYPGLWALVPSIGAGLVILAGHWLSVPRGPLTHPCLVWLGDRSYSLYLWHWPILMLGTAHGLRERPLATAGLVLLSVWAAILSYRFVERPFWKGSAGAASTRQILLVSVLVMVSAAFNINQLMDHVKPHETLAEQRHRWRADTPDLYRRQCDASYAHARVEPCVYGPAEAKRTVVLIGDSIGVQWFSMVREVFREPVWKTVVLTKSACALVDEDYYYGKSLYQVCTDWRNAALDWMDSTRPDVVVMGSAIGYDFTGTQWVEGSRRVLQRMSAATDAVIIIPGTPVLGIHGPGCISRHISESNRITLESCMAESRTQRARMITGYLDESAEAFSNVHVLDLNDLVCPGGRCSAISADGLLVYRDTQHLSDTFVWAKSPIIRERLLPLIQE